MNNPFELMKNLKNIQNQMSNVEEKLNNLKETASVGGDMVSVTLNGKMEVLDLKIDPSVVDVNDLTMLQVLIASAINTCNARIQDRLKKETMDLMGNNFNG